MSLNATGFEIALDGLTDATSGINKIAIDLDLGGITASQTITFAASAGGSSSGSVAGNNLPLTFTIDGGERVSSIILYNNTTQVGYITVAETTDSNDFDYVVDTLTITMT